MIRFYCYGKKDFCDKSERCNSEKNPGHKCEYLNGAGGEYRTVPDEAEEDSDE